MGPQGLGMVCLGVALRSTCTYCTLSANTLNIHGVTWEIKPKPHGLKPLKLGNFKYKVFALYSKG